MIQRHHGIGKDSQKTAGNDELSAHDGGDKLLPTLWTGSLTSFVLREASPDDVTAGDMLLIGGLSRGDMLGSVERRPVCFQAPAEVGGNAGYQRKHKNGVSNFTPLSDRGSSCPWKARPNCVRTYVV